MITGAEAASLPPSIGVAKVAELYGVGRWAIYENVANGTLPVQPIRVGRSLRFATASVLETLGIRPDHLMADQVESEPSQVRDHVSGPCHAVVTSGGGGE